MEKETSFQGKKFGGRTKLLGDGTLKERSRRIQKQTLVLRGEKTSSLRGNVFEGRAQNHLKRSGEKAEHGGAGGSPWKGRKMRRYQLGNKKERDERGKGVLGEGNRSGGLSILHREGEEKKFVGKGSRRSMCEAGTLHLELGSENLLGEGKRRS